MEASDTAVIRQHLIDPEICIRCNSCESTCPVGAISHDARNYVVDASICNLCMACVPPCPTGSIDNWRAMPRARAYGIGEQFGWDVLPPELSADVLALAGASENASPAAPHPQASPAAAGGAVFDASVYGAVTPPWSSREGDRQPLRTEGGGEVGSRNGRRQREGDGRRQGLRHASHRARFGSVTYPVLEGQSIGIIPPGTDADGRPHFPRQYSVACSPRNGEQPGYNNVSLTVKRVLEDHQGRPVRGVASNYLCDLKVGDAVEATGPFGVSFLMPNHPKSAIVMICTGTGSAPMRAMTEWRRRLRKSGKFDGGRLMLFFGPRTKEELPYFGPLLNLPKDFIDINFAFEAGRHQASRSATYRTRCGTRRPISLPDRRPGRLFLRLRLESDGGRRGQGAARHRDQGPGSNWGRMGRRSNATAGCIWKPTDRTMSTRTTP